MKRAAFARVERKEEEAVSKLRRKGLRSRGPRMTPIRRTAQGQDCTIRLPDICNRNPETTVLCHSNQLADGKGMGLKAPDTAAAFGCSACHDVLDGRAPRPEGMTLDDVLMAFDAGVERTHQILRRLGLMPLAPEPETENP
ncbi:MAG: DUF1364 family protein [Burkholderiales bacterium]|nr:DUF1364 family protein [Burkholderiales bacterium]